jgi:hypothetical protein
MDKRKTPPSVRSTVVVVDKRTDVNGHGVGHRARTTHRSLRRGRARRHRTAGSRRDRRRRFDERRRTHPRQTRSGVSSTVCVKLGTKFFDDFFSFFFFETASSSSSTSTLLHLSLQVLVLLPVPRDYFCKSAGRRVSSMRRSGTDAPRMAARTASACARLRWPWTRRSRFLVCDSAMDIAVSLSY